MYCDDTTFTIYVLMEYCGKSLFDVFGYTDEYTSITNDEEKIKNTIYSWLKTVAMGIQCMHKHKYAHLDIKPDNITISSTGQAKLIDFGLSYDFRETTKIQIQGTVHYIHPKMFVGTLTDITKCDIFALGITVIECAFALTNKPIYSACLSMKNGDIIFYQLLKYLHNEPSKSIDTIIAYVTGYRATTIIVGEYTIHDLFTAIKLIKDNHPLFMRMITDQCTIAEIIAECDRQLSTISP